MFGDKLSIATAIGLAILAVNELRGSAMLKRFNPRAPNLLFINQLALGILIIAYCGVSIYQTTHSAALKSAANSGNAELDQMMSGMIVPLTCGLYLTLAIAGGLTTILTAWYYHSRAKLIRNFLSQTPDWILQTLRAAG